MASRNPNDLCPEIRPLFDEWLIRVKAAGHDVLVICTWRPPSEQLAAFLAGKSKRKTGPHNYMKDGKPASRAWDFALIINGKISWDTKINADNDAFPDYEELGKIGEDLGLVWGGRWKSLCDADHLQLKGA